METLQPLQVYNKQTERLGAIVSKLDKHNVPFAPMKETFTEAYASLRALWTTMMYASIIKDEEIPQIILKEVIKDVDNFEKHAEIAIKVVMN